MFPHIPQLALNRVGAQIHSSDLISTPLRRIRHPYTTRRNANLLLPLAFPRAHAYRGGNMPAPGDPGPESGGPTSGRKVNVVATQHGRIFLAAAEWARLPRCARASAGDGRVDPLSDDDATPLGRTRNAFWMATKRYLTVYNTLSVRPGVPPRWTQQGVILGLCWPGYSHYFLQRADEILLHILTDGDRSLAACRKR
ncbi:hypothetical protein GY45DRAFT_1328753 [Cubamyces sp. BRFM 1775]|nr:hypothetical protein GY45DRAFT_1328753 [Cubamyces sp. BRFM 1775]